MLLAVMGFHEVRGGFCLCITKLEEAWKRDFILDLYYDKDWIIVTQENTSCRNGERQLRITSCGAYKIQCHIS